MIRVAVNETGGEKIMEKKLTGLTTEEVRQRRSEMTGQEFTPQITKTKAQIIKENVCTLFNFLNFTIAILLFAVGAYSNMLFIAIIIVNIIVGISQELKAKKLVDELSVLNRPTIQVIRNGKEKTVGIDGVVKDDLTILTSGRQICNDSIVVDGTLEVNESLLTGESDAVLKEKGSKLYSGSSVISGKAYARITHIGNENYAAKLANEVKKEKQVQSELLGSMKKVTRFTSFLIIPLGILLFIEALVLRGTNVNEAVVSSSAALLGMLPKGLVLLISVSLAAGVIRLAKMKILIQNIYSLETLAHVDVLCLDKTGTITDGKLKVHSIIPLSNFTNGETDRLLKSYLAASDDNNATFQAMADFYKPESIYQATSKIAFSSKRKWGCVTLDNRGTVFMGAPDILLGRVPQNMIQELEKGRRVIAIGYYGGAWQDKEKLPTEIHPVCGIILEDTIRNHAKETLEFFRKEGVDVKVISGDHVTTVSMIAKRAGLSRWADAIDLSTLGKDIDYDVICEKYAVFARVTPGQKRELVKALQRNGHQVAMTGDGVNDLLALREADCSIAVADGSDASRQIAQVVLLDSDFSSLPQVVMEGRKVIHNVTRTAGVFFIKTIYSVLVSMFCLLTNTAFPFIPIQITLIDACIEAYPSFLTIMESNTEQIRGRFLKTALANAAPFGITASIMIGVVSLLTPFSVAENRMVMYVLLISISMLAVVKSCIPFDALRGFICITMILGTPCALMIFPTLFEVTAITNTMLLFILLAAACSLMLILALECIKKLAVPAETGKKTRRSYKAA